MTIEHKTTHGPHGNGELAADWMLESGRVTRDLGGRREVENAIRLAVPNQDQTLTPASAAALRDALTEHLANILHIDYQFNADAGKDSMTATPSPGIRFDFNPASDQIHRAGDIIAHALRDSVGKRITPPDSWPNPWTPDPNAPTTADVPVDVKDAYAENARTIGASDVAGFTDEEAAAVGALKADGHGCGVDAQGFRYTASAARELEVKAARWNKSAVPAVPADAWARTASPVDTQVPNPVRSKTVRGWTDAQCEGAWNHLQFTGKDGLRDRPSGREYSRLAASVLRERINKINGADAKRD